jgi:hypothetical protein
LALDTLADVARNSQSDAARVTAATALLDRGYGRPPQALQRDVDPVEHRSTVDANTARAALLQALVHAGLAEPDDPIQPAAAGLRTG